MTRSPLRHAAPLTLAGLVWTVSAGIAGGAATGAPASTGPGRLAVYVGTYTDAGSRGIYRFELDRATGATTDPLLAGESENPSFLALHPNGRVLYAVNEVGSFGGGRTGALSAYAVDTAKGGLTRLGQQPSAGADPCHLVVDKAGRHVLVANYSSGTVAVLPIATDGRLQPPSVVRQQAGTGPDKARQEGPHAHAILLDQAERFALAADLGADRIFVYRYGAGASLEPNEPKAAALEPGAGPRHLAWHPSGKYLYSINELRSTVTALRYDAVRGVLEAFQTVTTLPAGFSGENTTAEVAVSADGRFLYGSNRGHDSLAVFAVDPVSGTLAPAGHVPTGGRAPRHFAIDPSGRWLLAANQDSNSVTVFRLDAATGRLTPVGKPIAVSKPVCVLFAEPPS